VQQDIEHDPTRSNVGVEWLGVRASTSERGGEGYCVKGGGGEEREREREWELFSLLQYLLQSCSRQSWGEDNGVSSTISSKRCVCVYLQWS
jgi:hypothetical protein